MTIKTAITAIDSVWELRRKPIGWLILAAAGLVLAFSVWDQAQAGRAWVQKIDKHVADHEKNEGRLEWKVDVLTDRHMEAAKAADEFRTEMKQDIRDLRRSVERSR